MSEQEVISPWEYSEGGPSKFNGCELEVMGANWIIHTVKSGDKKLACELDIKMLSGDNSGDSTKMLLTAGPTTNFVPSADGQFINKVGTQSQIGGSALWAIFGGSLKDAGFKGGDPKKGIASVLTGLRFICGEKEIAAEGNFKGGKANIVEKITAMPGEAKAETKTKGKAAAAPKADAKTETKAAATGEPVNIDKLARKAIVAIIKEQDTVKIAKLRAPLLAALQELSSADQINEVHEKLTDDKWTEANLDQLDLKIEDGKIVKQ